MAQASAILDLAFAMGLSTPKLVHGEEPNRARVCIISHGHGGQRHAVIIPAFLPLLEAGKRLAQSANVSQQTLHAALNLINRENMQSSHTVIATATNI